MTQRLIWSCSMLLTAAAHTVGAPAGEPTAPGVTIWAYDLDSPLTRRPTIAEGQTPNVYFVAPRLELKGGVGEGAARLEDEFAGEARGWIWIERPGEYGFLVSCDDGAALYLDDRPEAVADTQLPGGPDRFTAEGAITLAAGLHALRVPFYENRGEFRLSLQWRPPGQTGWKPVPAEVFRTEPGQTFAVSPGPKRWFYGADPLRPGDGRPLADGPEGVHPGMTLENFRGPEYQPPVGAMCFLPDGRLALATWNPAGAVDLLSNLDGREPGGVRVKRFADGLGEPLGLAWVGNSLLVTQKQEVTRLVDVDGDDVADRYEVVAAGWPSSYNYHEFSFNLVSLNGALYVTSSVPLKSGVTMYMPDATGKPDSAERSFPVSDGPGSVWRIDPASGAFAPIARGLRAPNGMGIGPDGRLFCCDNQGAWLPSSRLNLIREGGFYGHQLSPAGGREADPPVAWFPHGEIGNSPSEPVLVPDGVYRGQLLVGDVTYGGIQRVFVEHIADAAAPEGVRTQGCVFRFSQGLEAGVNRLAWGPDGCLYVGGVGSNGNWNHHGTKFGLQRLRPNGRVPFEVLKVEARAGGFLLTFTQPVVAAQLGMVDRYEVKTWSYRSTIDYGGPKIDVRSRPVSRAVPSPDGRRVYLETPGLQAGQVVYIRLRDLRSDRGEDPWSTEAWYTLSTLSEVPGPGFDDPFVHEDLARDPPPGAVVLFDGHGLEAWSRHDGSPAHWTVNPAGELCVSLAGGGVNEGDLVSREKFGDCFVHLEWLSPAGGDRGKQTNGNSGVKLQERYEIQIMNTPSRLAGTEPPKFNEAGAVYRQTPAMHNASLGAGVWQSYDIRFRAPRWETEGKITNARMTLWWNGVRVHDNVAIQDKTGMSPAEAPGDHPLLLQSHPSEANGPVRFRNVWVVRE